MQHPMQDTVCNEHKQTEMLTPLKVLCHKHNRWSAWSANEDKDAKEQERERVVIEKDNEYAVKHKQET